MWIFPGADGVFEYYDDDGISYSYEEGQYQRIPMRWNDREGTLTLGAQEGLLQKSRHLAVRRFGGETVREVLYTGETVTIRI